jgi:recombinational DNA repair protein RecT
MSTRALAKAKKNYGVIKKSFDDNLESIVRDTEDERAARLSVKSALIRIAEDEKLQACSPGSLIRSVTKAASMGLDFERNHCYLVPFKGEATLMVSYRGYQYKAGQAKYQIVAETVYDDEHFELTMAPMHVEHKPNLAGSKGKRVGAYAAAYRNGKLVAVTWCTNDDLDKARKIAEARKPSPAWSAWPKRMERKLPISRLCKELPDMPRDLIVEDIASDSQAQLSSVVDSPDDLQPVVHDKLEAGQHWGFGSADIVEPPAG